jgi:decaprenylphospho-beta-D-ribofuranose 2-oxidase
MKLSGWGLYPQIETQVIQPRSLDELIKEVKSTNSFIPRGQGRAYGDSALNDKCVLSTVRLNRMIAFDDMTGVLTCESGVTIDDVLSVFVPRGWFIAVTPGTRFISLGGAIASDVHGKNHHKVGSFSSCVRRFDLLLSSGDIVKCSRDENADLFEATFGGMGLTGVVTRVELMLDQVESAYVRQRTIKASNLTEVMRAFEETKDWTYSVAWIDCLATGDSLGRSVLTLGEHASAAESVGLAKGAPLVSAKKPKLSVPFSFPSFALNTLTVRVFNELYYRKAKAGDSVVPYEGFFYPLDRILNWNRIYGKRGFTQYQCVIPLEHSEQGLQELLHAISNSGLGSFLAVLKLFGKQEGLLSFPAEGYTLALDFPVSAPSLALLSRLDTIVKKYMGRLYLTKDVRMPAEFFDDTYTGSVEHFRQLRTQFDPEQKINSLQSKRLDL